MTTTLQLKLFGLCGGPRQLGVSSACEALLFSARISVRGRALANRQRCPLVSTARVRACQCTQQNHNLIEMLQYETISCVCSCFVFTYCRYFVVCFGPIYSKYTTYRSFADQTPVGNSTLSVPVQTAWSMSGKQRSGQMGIPWDTKPRIPNGFSSPKLTEQSCCNCLDAKHDYE